MLRRVVVRLHGLMVMAAVVSCCSGSGGVGHITAVAVVAVASCRSGCVAWWLGLHGLMVVLCCVAVAAWCGG
jgi:septum formation inhibitor-activating ATPase MinD